jgi:predicted extracellular nuclease
LKKIILPICLVFFLASCNLSIEKNDLKVSSALEIHDLQGCSHTSPYQNKSVSNIPGIVTWKSEEGFYLQSENQDDQFCSSEGIFVFTNQYPTVIPGDRVRVSGVVTEYFSGDESEHNLSVTEIQAKKIELLSSGNALPEPFHIAKKNNPPVPDKHIEEDAFAKFNPDSDGIDYWESLEGMLVEVEKAVVVGPRNSYGEVVVLPQDSVSQNLISKEGALIQTTEDVNPERILIDLPTTYEKNANLGAVFTTPIIGVLNYDYGNFRIEEINQPEITDKPVLSYPIEPASAGIFRLASYNVNNLSRFENGRMKKIAKQIVKNLASPEILVLEEMQDDSGSEADGTTSAKKNLTALIKNIEDLDGPNYAFYDPVVKDDQTGGKEGANIRTVILYRTDSGIQLINSALSWVNYDTDSFANSRLPVVCEFSYKGNPFFIIGVHLVSNNANSPLFGSVQPIEKPEEAKRVQQANQIINISQEIIKYAGDVPIYILGDFNDVPDSETMSVFSKQGFTDLMDSVTATERYSILYEGNATLFDHILANNAFSSTANQSWIQHINTGVAEKNQVSDHDPVMVEIAINK